MPNWIGPWSAWRRDIAAAALVGTFLGAVGPFGSFLNPGAGLRIAYWVAMSLLATVLFGFGLRWASYQGELRHRPQWLVTAAAVLIVAAPFSVIVSLCATTLWPEVARHVRPLDWYWQVLVISVPFGLLWQWSRRLDRRAPARSSRESPPPEAALVDRLHDAIGKPDARLICLQMEDHYVRVHTDRGSELVLSPLKAALAAIGDVDGLQVHRSWWVARDAVVRPVRAGRNVQLELINGVRAPVSRASVAKLRAAGWLGEARS